MHVWSESDAPALEMSNVEVDELSKRYGSLKGLSSRGERPGMV